MTAVSFVHVLELLIFRVPRLPGVKISEVPNSAVGQPRNSYIPPETPNLSSGGDPGARSAPELDWKKKKVKKSFFI